MQLIYNVSYVSTLFDMFNAKIVVDTMFMI